MEKQSATVKAECHLPNLRTVLKQEMISDKCLVCNQDTVAMICAEPVSVSFIKKKEKEKKKSSRRHDSCQLLESRVLDTSGDSKKHRESSAPVDRLSGSPDLAPF